jgi:NitT/TauT family transport system permease protein
VVLESCVALTVVKPVIERRPAIWLDALMLLGVVALVLGAANIAHEWRQPRQMTAAIDLSLRALPRYALYSFARGWIAYFFSLLFTLLIASWAFYDERARRFILVALDILQSLPVLAFLPVFELALVGLFPHSNTGVELVCVLAIFTSQVWNMTFSYYDSLRGTAPDFRMLGKLYNLNWWQRLWRVELPFSAQGLLYNSMVSMAGGWFFLAASEASSIGNTNYQVPGIGSYMSVATAQHNVRAQIYAIIAMSIIIVVVDRLIWWPLVVWARKFKLDDFGTGTARKSPLQLWLARSITAQKFGCYFQALKNKLVPPPHPPTAETSLVPPGTPPPHHGRINKLIYWLFLATVIALIVWGVTCIFALLSQIHPAEWLKIFGLAGLSFARVLAAVLIGTLWTVPFGIWVGLNPRLSNRLQPFIQFVASFPSTMIYAWLLGIVLLAGGNLQWGAVLLILFGTQWYILFNVAGAAAAIPNDMICCAKILHLSGWRRWTKFLIPAVLPSLVTGWITAAGGAWNATIVSEMVQIGDKNYVATGLGAYIDQATTNGDFSRLTAAALTMSLLVVIVNRTVWKPLQSLANERCRFIV